eukprot:g44876.t1
MEVLKVAAAATVSLRAVSLARGRFAVSGTPRNRSRILTLPSAVSAAYSTKTGQEATLVDRKVIHSQPSANRQKAGTRFFVSIIAIVLNKSAGGPDPRTTPGPTGSQTFRLVAIHDYSVHGVDFWGMEEFCMGSQARV